MIIPRRLAPAVLAAALALAAALPAAAEVLRTGQLSGQSGHVTIGTVSIERQGERMRVVLGPDFSLDGAPAPTVGFCRAGAFDEATELAPLRSLAGRQVYEIPAGLDVSDHDAFTVWCADFAVPLGSASLD